MNRKDFELGVILGLCSPAFAVRKKTSTAADLLDNEWPIEWKASEVKGNKGYVSGSMTFRRISDAVDYDYENAACAVTAVGDGVSAAFTTKNIGATDQSLGKLIYIQCTLDSTTYILALLVIEKPGTEGTVEFTETGTYYAFLNSSYVNVEFSNADLQFSLTAPQLVGYSYNGVVLPKLPEWDREAYPYAVIVYTREGKYVDGELVYYNSYRLFTSAEQFYVKNGSVSSTASHIFLYDLTQCQYWYCSDDVEATEWEDCGFYTTSNRNVYDPDDPTVCSITWSNADISKGNAVYHESSEPIPVYE